MLLYFASETVDNQELRQCLSYFFPVYCYSNPVNQRRVSNVCSSSSSTNPGCFLLTALSQPRPPQILLSTLALLKGVYDDLGDKNAMVAPLQIGLQLIDWTDPQKAMYVHGRRRFHRQGLRLTFPLEATRDRKSTRQSTLTSQCRWSKRCTRRSRVRFPVVLLREPCRRR